MTDSRDLFEYTSGQWLWNNEWQHAARKRVFNVEGLIVLAAASVNRPSQDVARFEKLAEGGFNRTFLLSMRDGFQMVARVPYPATEPKNLVVASEVATIDYLRLNDIPVPNIYGYSTTAENLAGTEYIFQEFLRGTNLGDVWFELGQNDRIAMVGKLVEFEAKLLSLEFPAGGSIFYSHDLHEKWDRVTLPQKDPAVSGLCIGPDLTLGLWYGKRRALQIPRRPYRTATEALVAGASKEFTYLSEFGKPLHPYNRLHREFCGYQRQSHLTYKDLLQKYLSITPYLLPKEADLLQPRLRHPDFSPNNIFVSKDLAITGIIDWQHTAIMPLFLNANIPSSLQNYGDPVSENLQVPRLTDDFDKLSEMEQFQQVLLHRKRHLHYYYVKNTIDSGTPLSRLLIHPQHILRRKLFGHASEPWEGDNITLQADLIEAIESWTKILESSPLSSPPSKGLNARLPDCPISFSLGEKNHCLAQFVEMQESDGTLQMAHEIVGCGSEGWVPNEMYEDAKKRAEQLLESTLEDAEDPERSRNLWIFNDFDEEEYM